MLLKLITCYQLKQNTVIGVVVLNMYYVRIVFLIKEGFDFDNEEKFILFESGNIVCRVKIDRRFDELKVIFSYGGFDHRETAEREGNKLFYSLKKRFVKKGIPINISLRKIRWILLTHSSHFI